MNVTPANITRLEPSQVFVFGSNLAGRHGKGAALTAKRKFGAKTGQGWGPAGQTYAIPTKDEGFYTLPLDYIGSEIERFLKFAARNPQTRFLVTAIGCGLAGYRPEQIAPLFFKYPVPDNVWLPQEFWDNIGVTIFGPGFKL